MYQISFQFRWWISFVFPFVCELVHMTIDKWCEINCMPILNQLFEKKYPIELEAISLVALWDWISFHHWICFYLDVFENRNCILASNRIRWIAIALQNSLFWFINRTERIWHCSSIAHSNLNSTDKIHFSLCFYSCGHIFYNTSEKIIA